LLLPEHCAVGRFAGDRAAFSALIPRPYGVKFKWLTLCGSVN
jgi:hypothetical protein